MFHTPSTPAPIGAQTQAGKPPVSDAALGVEDLEFSVGSSKPRPPTTPTVSIAGSQGPVASNTDAFSVDKFVDELKATSDAADVEDDVPLDFRPGEVGHAQRFVAYWGDSTRYDLDRDLWMTWQQTHWETDIKDSAVTYRMMGVADTILKTEVKALRRLVLEDGDMYARQAKRVHEEGLRLHNCRTISSSLSLAKVQPELKTRTSQYDSDPMALNCLSGVVNLKTSALAPHRPEEMHSRITQLTLAPEGSECPRWMQFLSDVMCGDAELISYIQRVVGYIMTGSVREQCFFIFFGGGSNGKSTFVNVIFRLLGSYAHNVDIRTFVNMDRGNSPRNDLAQLVGMRFVVSPEWERGVALDEAILKTISGGDLVSARFLNKELFQFNPVCKVVLCSNHRPVVKGTDHGIWRRMRLIPFLAKFEKDKVILDYDELMIAEEGPAIFRWAVEGAKLWASEGLKTPDTVCEATTEYRNTQDWLVTFLADRCELDANASVASQAIYNAYKNWCGPAGITSPIKQSDFNERLLSRNFQKKATKIANMWMGLKLKPNATGSTYIHYGDAVVESSTQFDHEIASRPNVENDLNFGI